MYSIPDYSLRFAAHCRSRLRFIEDAAQEIARAERGVQRYWIRFAPHGARAGLARGCSRERSPRGSA